MNYIFDFDGTICDSLKVSVQILNNFGKDNHLPPISQKDLKSLGTKGLIKNLKLTSSQVQEFEIYYRKEMTKFIPILSPYKGLSKIFHKLCIKNHLYIISSNSKNNIEIFLRKNQLESYFTDISSSTDIFGKNNTISLLIKKYDLYLTETYYVADETRDIEAAQKTKIHSVAVTWGFESKELLEATHPDIIIDKPKQLLKI
jgi:phosphoglycolate phosphatase